jgi:hypothetical protein
VKINEYVVPEPVNPLITPPVAEMSEFVKLLDASLRVAVIVAVWPAIIVDRELAS